MKRGRRINRHDEVSAYGRRIGQLPQLRGQYVRRHIEAGGQFGQATGPRYHRNLGIAGHEHLSSALKTKSLLDPSPIYTIRNFRNFRNQPLYSMAYINQIRNDP